MPSAALGVVLLAFANCPAQSSGPVHLTAIEYAAQNSAIEDSAALPAQADLTPADQKFLDDLERRGMQFYVDDADPVTGLMPDRAGANGGLSSVGSPCSIASVGFGVTALCIGDNRGWISHQEAYDRCLRPLQFLHDHAVQVNGYFYHFLNMHTGQRVWNCELSNIDTALLMAGVLTVRQHFPNTPLSVLADQMYRSVDWNWMISQDGTAFMGWNPPNEALEQSLAHGGTTDTRDGFIQSRWSFFSEGPPLIYLLGLGSPTHPLPAAVWRAWKREPVTTYDGLTFMECPPLFTHQYPQSWLDLRGLRDDYADYFRDSQLATLAQRQWFADELSKQFPLYSLNVWGLTASDSAHGYTAWGGPPAQGDVDGSVVPCAAGGSLAFEPRICLDALETMRRKWGDKAYEKYGFVDAFNPATGWYNPDVLGIDLGPMVLMAENCRTGFVWKTFMSSPEITAALKTAGFRRLKSNDALPPTMSIFAATAADASMAGGR
jgi:hypothetical protein